MRSSTGKSTRQSMNLYKFYVTTLLVISPSAVTNNPTNSDVCDVTDIDRFDCFPDPGANEQKCVDRGCCWRPAFDVDAPLNVPYCYYGRNNFGYKVTAVKATGTGWTINLVLQGHGGPFGGNINNVAVFVGIETADRIRITIKDPNNKRYEVPVPTPEKPPKVSHPNYRFTYTDFPFGFAVTRVSNGRTIFNSSVGGFVFSDQFLQMSSLLPSNNIYGLGEHVLGLRLNTSWTRLTLFSRDIADPEGGINLYGVHPFYLNLENDGQANGVFLLNSNAMDIIIQPKPAITYRTIGGILDFYVFLGPTPEQVVQQFTATIGRSTMPPYWALGFHLCRYGYNSLANMEMVRKRMADNGIPQDTQWNDIDYMDNYKDFTIDGNNYNGLPEFVDRLHEQGMHYVIMTDPAISTTQGYKPYDDGVAKDVFIKDHNGKILVGKVWPGLTAFPDFTNENTTAYWYTHIKDFHDTIKFDGFWIDMNEPSNFVQGSINGCPQTNLDYPPFTPAVVGGVLSGKTICMSSQQNYGKHYDLHSLYGHTEAVATMSALTKILSKRSLVITRSSYSGTGKHAGHWLGDNHSTWEDLYRSIAGFLNFNIFGISIAGSDICGFLGDTTEELCSRWMQLGAFYPFMRNHNSIGMRDQDPAAFGNQLITASKEALKVRYTLLPYLYTLYFESHSTGSPVARPLFFEFPKVSDTYGIDQQFMWGSALLISPVLIQGATSIYAYVPPGIWYEYYKGALVDSKGETVTLPAAFDKVNLHLRGGFIVPTQDPDITTTKSRMNDFGVLVAPDINDEAEGSFYMDDGESLLEESLGKTTVMKFQYQKGKFRSSSQRSGYTPEHNRFAHMKVYGVAQSPTKVMANGKAVQFHYDASNKVLTTVNMQLKMTDNNEVTWS